MHCNNSGNADCPIDVDGVADAHPAPGGGPPVVKRDPSSSPGGGHAAVKREAAKKTGEEDQPSAASAKKAGEEDQPSAVLAKKAGEEDGERPSAVAVAATESEGEDGGVKKPDPPARQRWTFYGTLLSTANITAQSLGRLPGLAEFIHHRRREDAAPILYARFDRRSRLTEVRSLTNPLPRTTT